MLVSLNEPIGSPSAHSSDEPRPRSIVSLLLSVIRLETTRGYTGWEYRYPTYLRVHSYFLCLRLATATRGTTRRAGRRERKRTHISTADSDSQNFLLERINVVCRRRYIKGKVRSAEPSYRDLTNTLVSDVAQTASRVTISFSTCWRAVLPTLTSLPTVIAVSQPDSGRLAL
jgi:hypothetical protein